MIIQPKGIIIHSMAENIIYNDKILTALELLKELKLSIHTLINIDGTRTEMVLPPNRSLHAGISKHNNLTNLNNHYLGVEILLKGTHDYNSFIKRIKEPFPFNTLQISTLIECCKHWMKQYNIPIENVVRHSDVSGDDIRGIRKGKLDPGSGFNWIKFKDDLKK
jgi:N-acetyl-anhydromuramyl-L-alanine amidase AmpD